MPAPQLSLEDAYDLLLSWSKTLVNKVTTHKQESATSLGELRETIEEVVGCMKCLEEAAVRSRK
jgi:hypothetical protein